MPAAIAMPVRLPDMICSSRFSHPSDDPTGRSSPVSRMAWPSKWLRVRCGIAIACTTVSSPRPRTYAAAPGLAPARTCRRAESARIRSKANDPRRERYAGSPYGTTAARPSKPPRSSTNTKPPRLIDLREVDDRQGERRHPAVAHGAERTCGGSSLSPLECRAARASAIRS